MKTKKIGRDDVLSALKTRAPRAMHLMEVVGALKIAKRRADAVRDVLEELRDLGMAQEMPGNRFRLANEPAPRRASGARRGPEPRAETSTEATGWLSIHPRGFGFVATDDGEDDVFIPPTGRSNAMHGDRVRVHVRPSAKGREGTIVEVIRRGVGRIAGTYRKQRRRAWIEPSDRRLPERVEVVGTVPLGVGRDEEVVAAIEKWPDAHERDGGQMAARILSSLGRAGSAEVEIKKIKIREGIEEEFDEPVLLEAQAFGTRVPTAEIARREDLRDLELCTIDPATARDHDDAVWAERLDGGGFRVIVAIADVSYYVRPETALDEAALARSTSIYLPDRVIPMLPHELSSNLASLVPNEDRLTMAVEVTLGPKGAIRGRRFIEGVMRSRARLSYDGVARALGMTDEAKRQPAAEKRIPLLKTLFDISAVLRAKRKRRGSLDFHLPEAEIVLGEDSEPIDIRRSRTDPGIKQAYAMIEDLMLLANEVVAADLARRNIPAIYRVHGAPDEDKIEIFRELALSLGYRLDEDAAENPKKLARFLDSLENDDHKTALSSLLLRAMQQASYETTNIGHFALAAKSYLHFTSPIRRYPDLAVHRVVRALIREERMNKAELHERLKVQAATASRLERRAMLIDREATNLYRALLMKDRAGETFEATIAGVNEHGLYVAFDEPFVEARVPVDTLGDDWYELDPLGMRLVGKRSGHAFAVSDRVEVRLVSVSIEDRELVVEISGRPEPTRVRGAKKKAKKKRARSRGDSLRGTKPSKSRRTRGAPKKRSGPRRR